MKSKAIERTALTIGVLLLVASVGALAQNSAATTFGGELNAYSPQTTGSSGTTGPYEIRGPWSLTVKGSTANFSADVNMEESDGWCISQNGSNFDVTGSATIMANGTIAAISPSVLTIDVTGGTDRKFSNITLTFQAPASGHFGTEPVPGVIRSITGSSGKKRK